jgi:acyl-coenzyme A thioesterase PaaI-like protein
MGNLHGGCAAFICDYASSCNLLFLSDGSWSYAGVSSSLSLVYHAAAPK